MSYNMKGSGKRIQQLRIQHECSQEQLAKELNIDRSNLSRIETGKRSCSLDLLIQISTLFDVSLDFILLGQEKQAISVETRQLENDIEVLIKQLKRSRTNSRLCQTGTVMCQSRSNKFRKFPVQ